MSKSPAHLVLITIFLLTIGCTRSLKSPTEMVESLPAPQQKTTSTPPTETPVQTLTPVTPSPTPGEQQPEADQVIFTIPNGEPWDGKEGDPRPDWLGWGAETFTVAPDGTFWIADTAVTPNRLLHYSPQGELLQEISLEDQVAFAYDLAVTPVSLWVLDIASQPSRVVKLSLEGETLSSLDIPMKIITYEGMPVYNGAFSLMVDESGALLLDSINGIYQLVDASGKLDVQPLEMFTFYGHTYQAGTYDEASGELPFYVDGAPLEVPAGFKIETPLLGVNPDGSFALAGTIEQGDSPADHLVVVFSAAREVLGTARQAPQTFYKDWNHHLAFGADGAIYQLLSNPDHSVQVMRLGFPQSLPPWAENPLPTPVQLTPLQPVESPATDEEQARNALVEFFANLSAGNYAEAEALFDGDVSQYARAPMEGESVEDYWAYLCDYLWCLPVAEVTEAEQISEDEFLFYTVFVGADGTRFEIGACCGGDPAAAPPVWQFAYPVQKIDGVWKVRRAPLFTP